MSRFGGRSGKAAASLVLGVLSLGGLFITGIPALVLGLQGLREVNASDGRLQGRGLAIAGMVLGALMTLVSCAGLGVGALLILREKANLLTCQNNLRRTGMALDLYYGRAKAFPTGTIIREDLPPPERLSWFVTLLPDLGLQNLYERIDRKAGWNALVNRQAVETPIRLLVCPSRSDVGQRPYFTSYVGIAGVGENAVSLPARDPDTGVFGYDRATTLEEVTRGTSQTMMVTESEAANGPWAAGGPPTVRALVPALEPYVGPGRPFGGLHPGGLNVLFVDGSVRFVEASIDPKLFEAMARIRAGAD